MQTIYFVYCEALIAFAILVWMQFKTGLDKFAIFVAFCVVVVTAFATVVEFIFHSINSGVYMEWFVGKLSETKEFFRENVAKDHTLKLYACMMAYFVYQLYQRKRNTVVYMRMNQSLEGYNPEKMVPGSSFQLNATMPSFQCSVYGSEDDATYYPLGQAFSTQFGVVTAAHVLVDCKYIQLVKDTRTVSINFDRITYLDGDMALYKVTPQEKLKLGLSDAKFAKEAVVEKMGPMVQVVAFGSRSFGFLNPYKQFGFCRYNGSTVKGFSGAPYYVNKTVYGMHLGGDVVNLGYEGAYIQSLLKPTKTVVKTPESSDDWLIDQAIALRQFEYDRSPYDPDEYRVRIGNRYHIVETDVLEQLLAVSAGRSKREVPYDHERNPIPPEPAPRTHPVIPANYRCDPVPVDDLPLAPREAFEFDQGNLRRGPSVNVGAPGKAVEHPVVQSVSLPTSSQTSCLSQKPLEPSHMESLPLMPAQPKGASKSTRQRQNIRARYRALQSKYERLKTAYDLTQPGPSRSPESGIP